MFIPKKMFRLNHAKWSTGNFPVGPTGASPSALAMTPTSWTARLDGSWMGRYTKATSTFPSSYMTYCDIYKYRVSTLKIAIWFGWNWYQPIDINPFKHLVSYVWYYIQSPSQSPAPPGWVASCILAGRLLPLGDWSLGQTLLPPRWHAHRWGPGISSIHSRVPQASGISSYSFHLGCHDISWYIQEFLMCFIWYVFLLLWDGNRWQRSSPSLPIVTAFHCLFFTGPMNRKIMNSTALNYDKAWRMKDGAKVQYNLWKQGRMTYHQID